MVAALAVGISLWPGARPAAAAETSDWWGGAATFPANHSVGTSMYRGGVWSYTDRYGDGTGPNTDNKHREDYFGAVPGVGQDFTYDFFGTHRLASNGDYLLPSDNVKTPVGSADIIFFQVRQASEGLQVRVVFAALGTHTILTLGIQDQGARTASTPFPHNAALGCGTCGIDRFVTVWGSDGDIQTGAGTSLGKPQRVVADLNVNAIDFVVPTAKLGATASTWRFWLAAGVFDGTNGYSGFNNGNQATGAPRTASDTRTGVYDLAFAPDNRRTVDDRAQADLLTLGDAAPAVAEVDMAALASGLDRLDNMPTSGPVEQILVSSLNLGEGTDSGSGPATYQFPEPGSVYHYLGRLEPYLVQLPAGYDPARPLSTAISLHGYNGYYDETYFELQDFPPNFSQPSGFIKRLSDAGMIGVFPLGRGDIQYNRDGEKDVLEVIADAEQHFAVDPTRLHLVGLSMGGAGTWQLGEHHPDLFADIAPALPNTPTDTVNTLLTLQALGVPVPTLSALSPQAGIADEDALPNLINTPTFVLTAIGDFDADVVARQYYSDLRDLGAEAHVKTLLESTHSFEVLRKSYDELFQFWASHRAVAVPARVTYVDHTSWSYPQFGAVDDGAYWVHGLTPVPTDIRGGGIGRLDADAVTLPRQETSTTEVTSTGGDVAAASLYLRSDAQPKPVRPRPTGNALALTMASLSAGSIDVSPLRVDYSQPYCVASTADRPVDIALTGGSWSAPGVTGVPFTVSAGRVLLKVPAGKSFAVVSSAGVQPGADPCAAVRGASTANDLSASSGKVPLKGSGLPNTSRGSALTGGTLPGVAILLGVLAGSLLWRRRNRARQARCGLA